MDELETSGSDVNTEASSPSTESTSSESSSEAPAQSASEQGNKQEQYVPYDRFKELIEQKNQFSRQLEEQQRAFKELEERVSKQSQPQTPQIDPKKMVERLKGIDPEFAQYQEHLLNELSQARQFQQQMEQRAYMDNARNTVSKLQSELKVDPMLHQAYLSQIPMGTPVGEIEKAYKSLHQNMSKYIEDQKRSALSSYSKEKKADTAVPGPSKTATPKATPPKNGYSKDREEARAQLTQRIVEHMRSQRDV